VRITAKIDYAVRAGAELAAADPEEWINAERIGTAQGIPTAFLLNILSVLRAKGLVESRRGVDGGYRLARPADEIAVADIIRAIDGPLANVGGTLVEDMHYEGAAASLRDTWVALRATMRTVLEEVTLASIAAGNLPKHVQKTLAEDESWVTRPRPGTA
jgi:Rrf2 family protein